MSNTRTRLTSLLLAAAVALLTGGSALAFAAPAGTGAPVYQATSTIPVGGTPNAVAVNPRTNTVYVADGKINDGRVRGFNGTTGAVTFTRAWGYASPCGIAVNARTNTAYVADGVLVTAINGSTGKGILLTNTGWLGDSDTTVSLGAGACGIAVNETTNTVYVAAELDDTVSAVNGTTGAVKFTTKVAPGPCAVAVNARTNTVYVANCGTPAGPTTVRGGDTVSVINGTTGKVTSTIKVGDTLTRGKVPFTPRGIAVNETTNTIYVADGSDASVSVINGATRRMTSTINVAAAAGGVAVNETTNTVFVTTWANKSVQVINGATGEVISTVAVGAAPFRVAANATTNTVYVADGTVAVTDKGENSTGGPINAVSVLSVVAGAVANVRMDNHQKTPADCPLSTFPSLADQDKCSEEYSVDAAPGMPGLLAGYLPGGGTVDEVRDPVAWGRVLYFELPDNPAQEWTSESLLDQYKAGRATGATTTGGVLTIPAHYFKFWWRTNLPMRGLGGVGETIEGRSSAADGAVSWEVWPTPSHGVTTWVNTVGFVYRPTSVGTDTFALRVCRKNTDKVLAFVTFTQCDYRSLKITTTAVPPTPVTTTTMMTTPPGWPTPTAEPPDTTTTSAFTPPIPTGVPAGQAPDTAPTGGQLTTGGLTGLVALLALGAAFALRRRLSTTTRNRTLVGALAISAVLLLSSATILGNHYLGGGNSHAGRALSSGPLPPSLVPTPASSTAPTTTVPASTGVPVQLVVPSHHLQAAVSANHLDAAGNIFVPPNPRAVSWASQDAAPGSTRGTIILAAHINYSGVAGAFADLADYKVGQIITLVMADGRKINYKVAAEPLEVLKTKLGARAQELFDQTSSYGPAGSPKSGRLLLVSCGGAFDNRTGHYKSNILVYALPV